MGAGNFEAATSTASRILPCTCARNVNGCDFLASSPVVACHANDTVNILPMPLTAAINICKMRISCSRCSLHRGTHTVTPVIQFPPAKCIFLCGCFIVMSGVRVNNSPLGQLRGSKWLALHDCMAALRLCSCVRSSARQGSQVLRSRFLFNLCARNVCTLLQQ